MMSCLFVHVKGQEYNLGYLYSIVASLYRIQQASLFIVLSYLIHSIGQGADDDFCLII